MDFETRIRINQIKEWLEYENVLEAIAFCLHTDPQLIVAALTEKTTEQEGYNRYSIPKNSNGIRVIKNPFPNLKLLLRLLKEFLYHFETSTNATGCVPGKTTKDNVRPHRKSNLFIQMDIADAFESVTTNHVVNTLEPLLKQKIAEFENHYPVDFPTLNDHEKDVFCNIMTSLITVDGSLPQGASTSPATFNLILNSIDTQIKAALDPNFNYTRYVDDLTLSCQIDEDQNPETIADHVQAEVSAILNQAGFQISPHKVKTTLLTKPGDKVTITGINLTYEHNLEVKENTINNYIHFIDLVNEISDLLNDEMYDELITFLETQQLTPYFKPETLRQLEDCLGYHDFAGIKLTIQHQILRIEAFRDYCTRTMGYVPRELVKAYNTLKRHHPRLWISPTEETSAQVYTFALAPPCEEAGYSQWAA